MVIASEDIEVVMIVECIVTKVQPQDADLKLESNQFYQVGSGLK